MKKVSHTVRTIAALTKAGFLLTSFNIHAAFAEHSRALNEKSIDYARVIASKPVYIIVEHSIPKERCWTETVRRETRQHKHKSATPVLVGSLIGGAVGRAIGHDRHHRRVGTVIGSVIGASIGSDIAERKASHRNTHVSYEDVERCEITEKVEQREQLIGYDVRYRYRGEVYTTRMSQRPGDRIKIAIQTRVIDE